jgi:hypothetical protein
VSLSWIMLNLKASDDGECHTELLGLQTLSIIHNSRYYKNNVLEISSISTYGWERERRLLLGPLARTNLSHRRQHESTFASLSSGCHLWCPCLYGHKCVCTCADVPRMWTSFSATAHTERLSSQKVALVVTSTSSCGYCAAGIITRYP